MKAILNHSLYNKYYPIGSEEEKQLFLEKERHNLYIAIDKLLNESQVNLKQMEQKYDRRMKETISFLGHINFRNIRHNKRVSQEMESDSGIRKMRENIEDCTEIADAIIEYRENISIASLNKMLEALNSMKHNRIVNAAFGLGVAVLAIAILFIV